MFKPLLIAAFLMFYINCAYTQQQRFAFTTAKMGSPFTIVLYHSDSAKATQLCNESFLLVDSMVNIFSDYIDSSELNRLSARAGSDSSMVVSPDMYQLLTIAKLAFEQSGGTFDITVGQLSIIWRAARKQHTFPADSVVHAATKTIGFNNVSIDTITKKVRLMQHGMRLDAGGIAQGYIAQKVIDFLQQKGVQSALVDVSGDIVSLMPPPAAKGWKIGINKPGDEQQVLKNYLLVKNQAVTTSGDVYQYIENNGKRYSHVIDPRTGYGITTQKNVTVIAANGTNADWLTKACSILPVNKAKRLANKFNAGLLINKLHHGRIKSYSNKLFRQQLAVGGKN